MSTSIGDPFALASYGLPSREKKGKGKSADHAAPNIFANWYGLPRGNDGQVTVAAQGDGIHILDLTGLHPVSSHSLGPSSRFTCAPASIVLSEEEENYRYTFTAMSSSTEIEPSSSGRTIWRWRESLADSASSSQEKRSFQTEHHVAHTFVSNLIPKHVFIIAEDGEMTCTNFDLEKTFSWKPTSAMKLLKAVILPRAECVFIEDSSSLPMNGALLNLFLNEGEKTLFQSIAFDREGNPVILESTEIPHSFDEILDISFNSSGFISFIQKTGRWSSFRLSVVNSKLFFTPLLNDLHLCGLTFVEDSLHKGETRHAVSLLPLSSSYVLVSGTTTDETPQIALLLCDVQYGVFLHSTLLPIPSSIVGKPWVELVSASSSQALLCLSPTEYTQQSQARSTIFVVPYNVASTSSIATVLGRGQGTKWLATGDRRKTTKATEIIIPSDPLALDAEYEDLLQTIQDAIEEERPLDADSAFFDWVRIQTAKLKESPASQKNGAMDVEHNVIKPAGEEEEKEKRQRFSDTRLQLGHTFVTRILRVIYLTEASAKSPYSPQILLNLMERGVVRNSMLDGGLLTVLLQRKDWHSIRSALGRVLDISEENVIKALITVIKANRAPAEDKMAVDQPANADSVPSSNIFLASCLAYPTSSIPLRKAFKDNFTDIDDVTEVLKILSHWIGQTLNQEVKMTLPKAKKNEDGIPLVKIKRAPRRKPDAVPELENILHFLQAVLDSSFLRLLQHPPSHEILRQIQTQLEPEIQYNQELEALRGPLTPFVKAQARALAEAKSGRRRENEVDWRKRRKQIQEQNAISIGLYQIEELAF